MLSKGGRWPPSGYNGLKVALNKDQMLNGKAWGNTEMVSFLLVMNGVCFDCMHD